MTCWDKRELCDLDCVFATTHEGEGNLKHCSMDCMAKHMECKDSPETVEYISVRAGSRTFSRLL